MTQRQKEERIECAILIAFFGFSIVAISVLTLAFLFYA